MATLRKITVHVSEDLLRKAQKSTHQGVTATVRKGLELVSATETNRKLRQLRGKVRFSIDLASLREDRR